MSSSTLHIILGNCLFENIKPLNIKDNDIILMIEDESLCTHYIYHKHKIILFLSAMRNYRDELENKLKKQHIKATIEYIELQKEKPKQELSFEEQIKKILNNNLNISTLQLYDIEDNFFKKRIEEFVNKQNISFSILPSQGFITSHEEFITYRESYKRLFMNDFYQYQRKRLNILMDEHKKPIGGKWSFDEENRKKIPNNLTLPKDNTISIQDSKNPHLKDVIELVHSRFSNHPGNSENFYLPTTREEALSWLNEFLIHKFELFGPYEDAILKEENFLFHSVLSPMLNMGLLTPKEVVDKALTYYEEHDIKLSSVEGFIRQIIGWREFVRGCYHYIDYEEKERKKELNFLNHTRKLTQHWYEGTTGIEPVDDSIKKVLKYSYNHHIERLMVLGNIMLLCEIDPKEVYKWFMEMYVDSSDWVMAPNVYSMSQFSDGGIDNGGFATKPYIAGSNYICKMSNYSKNEDWCEIVDGLYWRFIDKKRELFLKNPRMGMMVKLLDNMDEEKKRRLFLRAEEFLQQYTN
ncbi:MAG: cryptochrome/photolyase family protein [Nanoarchaeota archaeon]|nr:cryptochrome/photolyase family protein [Nanoarchaeota archaeon]